MCIHPQIFRILDHGVCRFPNIPHIGNCFACRKICRTHSLDHLEPRLFWTSRLDKRKLHPIRLAIHLWGDLRNSFHLQSIIFPFHLASHLSIHPHSKLCDWLDSSRVIQLRYSSWEKACLNMKTFTSFKFLSQGIFNFDEKPGALIGSPGIIFRRCISLMFLNFEAGTLRFLSSASFSTSVILRSKPWCAVASPSHVDPISFQVNKLYWYPFKLDGFWMGVWFQHSPSNPKIFKTCP